MSPGTAASLGSSVILWTNCANHAATMPTATIGSGVLLAAVGIAATTLRFDLVQAALFYGLRIDLAGLASTPERIYSGALIAAFACLGAAAVSCLFGPGRTRLAGRGLLLMAASGAEISSPEPALFTLCGLLAMTVASGADHRPNLTAAEPPEGQPSGVASEPPEKCSA